MENNFQQCQLKETNKWIRIQQTFSFPLEENLLPNWLGLGFEIKIQRKSEERSWKRRSKRSVRRAETGFGKKLLIQIPFQGKLTFFHNN